MLKRRCPYVVVATLIGALASAMVGIDSFSNLLAQPTAKVTLPAHVNIFRRVIDPGGTGYVWSFDPMAAPLQSPKVKLVAADKSSVELPTFRLGWPAAQWELPYHIGFNIPNDTQLGEYTLVLDNGQFRVAIQSKATRKQPKQMSATANEADIEAALAEGDIQLATTRYTFMRAIKVPAGRRIAFNGATVARLPDQDYRNRVFVMSDGVELIGPGTIENADDTSIALHGKSGENVTIRRLTFRFGEFGYWDSAGLRVSDCLLDHCGWRITRGGLFDKIRCVGISRAHNAFQATACQLENIAPTAMFDIEFDATPQGLRFDSSASPISNFLASGVRFRCVDACDNQDELIGFEGPANAVSRCLFFHIRESGCVGPCVEMWNAPVHDCIFRDMRTTCDVRLDSAVGARQSDNEFIDCYASRFLAVGNAKNNRFTSCGAIPRPSPQNQFSTHGLPPINPIRPGFDLVNGNAMHSCWTKP